MVLELQSEHESQWAAIGSIAEKIGCTSETLRKWVLRTNTELSAVEIVLRYKQLKPLRTVVENRVAHWYVVPRIFRAR